MSHERKSRLQTIVNCSNHNRPFTTAEGIRTLINQQSLSGTT
jgi:hypothetical protein